MKHRHHSETDGALSFTFPSGAMTTWFITVQKGHQGQQALNLFQCQVMTWMDRLQESPNQWSKTVAEGKNLYAPKTGTCEVMADGMWFTK